MRSVEAERLARNLHLLAVTSFGRLVQLRQDVKYHIYSPCNNFVQPIFHRI